MIHLCDKGGKIIGDLVGVGRVDGLGDVGYKFGPKVPPLAALHPDHFVQCDLCQFNSELCTTLDSFMVCNVVFF